MSMLLSFRSIAFPSSSLAPRVLVSLGLLAAGAGLASAQTVIPSDAKPTCVVTPVEFNGRFTSGSVTPNGGVDPADSVTFPNIPNCSFYKWSEQMFLWLTSPAPSKYGQGSHVFNSPVFYDVTPDQNGKRTLIANTAGRVRNFGISISELGPKGKPVVFDNTGKMFNIIRPELGPNKKPIILNRAGQPIEIERSAMESGRAVLLDKSGTTIQPKVTRGLVQMRAKDGKLLDLRFSKTLLNGKPFLIDRFGNAVPTEQGQADGSVLMAQNGSLVYYALQVNDVYAYFLTGQKDNKIAATTFPTTPAALNSIEAFALMSSPPKAFPDANALAIELKSAWIEATGLDTSKYVTVTATVPTYNTSNPLQWVATGTRQATLAMVGIHVVGSAAGHPEMIWATFEHVDNSRSPAYSYTNASNATVNVPQNNGGSWTFSTTPPSANPNVATISNAPPNITAANPPTPIGPSDVMRVSPWGMPGNATASNTDIVSINSSVLTKLAAGDVRKNYIMTGATWTIGGANPNSGTQVGTKMLANSTMETFVQPSNCFDCHQGQGALNMLGTPGTDQGLSHVYGLITPLFP